MQDEGVWKRARLRESDENERRGPFSQAVDCTLAANRLELWMVQECKTARLGFNWALMVNCESQRMCQRSSCHLFKVSLVERYGCC